MHYRKPVGETALARSVFNPLPFPSSLLVILQPEFFERETNFKLNISIEVLKCFFRLVASFIRGFIKEDRNSWIYDSIWGDIRGEKGFKFYYFCVVYFWYPARFEFLQYKSIVLFVYDKYLYLISSASCLSISIILGVFLLQRKKKEKHVERNSLVALINIISREKKLLMYRSIGETFTG